MLIEDRIFAKKIIDPVLLTKVGFVLVDDVYCFESELDKDFIIKVIYSDKLNIIVYDKVLGEEYVGFRHPNGTYSLKIAAEVESFLLKLSLLIAKDQIYRLKQSQRINEYMETVYGKAEFPFGDDCGVYKESSNQKWYALIMSIAFNKLDKNKGDELVEILNIKVNKSELSTLLKRDGVYPAYHMNKQNWVSIVLNECLGDNELILFINSSYDLVQNSMNERKYFKRRSHVY